MIGVALVVVDLLLGNQVLFVVIEGLVAGVEEDVMVVASEAEPKHEFAGDPILRCFVEMFLVMSNNS